MNARHYTSLDQQALGWAMHGTSPKHTWAALWAFIMGKVAS